MQMETGSVYRVKHRRKGNFYLAVRFTDKNFTTGMILAGKAQAIMEENEVDAGNEVTIRNTLCEFEKVSIKEAVEL